MPNGDAPDEIKEKWIGIEMPCLLYDPSCFGRQVLSKHVVGAQASYVVNQTVAIEELAKKAPEAARWWNLAGYPESATALWIFSAYCVEVLEAPASASLFTGENN